MIYADLLTNCLSSLARVSVGFVIGSSIGFALAIGRFYLPDIVKRNFLAKLILDSAKYPPPIAWIPFVILFFGIGNLSSVVLVAVGVFPAVFTQIYEGLERVNQKLVRVADNLEIFGVRRLRGVLLPAIQPEIFTGLRVGIGMGWMSIIAAEMVAGQEGLGYAIQLYRLELNHEAMILYIAVIGVLGFCFQEILKQIENRTCRWKRL